MGISDPSIFAKVTGFLPTLDGAHVTIKSDLQFFELELGGEFKRDGANGKTSLDALCRVLDEIIPTITIITPLYLFFDELEVFFHTTEQYHRDQRMVRDLMFAVANFNEIARRGHAPIHIIAGVRSEVIDAMGALGEEVDRLVHDKGFNLAWYLAKRSLHHPLIEIVRRKILASEEAAGIKRASQEDVLGSYFPTNINGQSIDAFLLDRSFYKPRDIVWRLTIAQKQYPNEPQFTIDMLNETDIEYSTKLWDEVRYELSATYSQVDIDVIEMVIAGSTLYFSLADMTERFENAAQHSANTQKLLAKRSVREVLSDLYRLGAVGNAFRTGTTGDQIKNRWAFRGDANLLADKRMTIHGALAKRLSAIAPRRRGTRAGR